MKKILSVYASPWLVASVLLSLSIPRMSSAQEAVEAAPADQGSSIRIAAQGRVSAVNIVSNTNFINAAAPPVTLGARLMDGRLFAGLGLGFISFNDDGPSGFTLSPTVTFDVLASQMGAMYVLGLLNLGTAKDGAQDGFFFGFNAGIGIRGKINEALSFGTEWGFAFQTADIPDVSTGLGGTTSGGPDTSPGIFGNFVVEASVGL